MKMYYNKKNKEITIIATEDEMPTVNYVIDRGKGTYKNQYMLHWSSCNDGYFSAYKDAKELKEHNIYKDEDKVTFCKTIKKKVKV